MFSPQIRFEQKAATTVQLETTIQGLEEIRQRQASKIADLMASSEANQITAHRKLQQHYENQKLQRTGEIEGTYHLLEDLRKEISDVRTFSFCFFPHKYFKCFICISFRIARFFSEKKFKNTTISYSIFSFF